MNKFKRYSIIISLVGLILIITGVTYSFFNYTRTGLANNISVGNISFNSSQDGNINLTNVFPITQSELNNDETNHDSVTISITGNTIYTDGIEYLVTITDVNNTYNNKVVPIGFKIEEEDIGTSNDNYYTNRGGNSSIYKLHSGNIKEGKYLLAGYIASGSTGIDGTITITFYVDKDKIAISDTYLNGGETSSEWVNGRTVFTTSEWNSFQGNNALSFKIKVEANEGVWVEEPDPDNVLPDSCFSTKMRALYYLNNNLNSTQLANCIDYYDGYTFDTGTTAESYCLGTGTIDGKTIGENNLIGGNDTLLENGIIRRELELEIYDYDDTCGSDVVIPSKMNYTKLIRNPNMTTSQYNTCVSYLSSKYNWLETSGIEDWCNGEANSSNITLEERVNMSFSTDELTYLKNEGIIIDGPTQQYDVVSIQSSSFGYAGEQGEYDLSKYYNLSSLVFPRNLKIIGVSTVVVGDGKIPPQNIVIPQSVVMINGFAFTITDTSTNRPTIPNTTLTILGKPLVYDVSLPAYETITYGGTCQELKRGLYSGIYAVFSKGDDDDRSIYVNTTDNNQCEIRDMYE